jgi:hypothetical protein
MSLLVRTHKLSATMRSALNRLGGIVKEGPLDLEDISLAEIDALALVLQLPVQQLEEHFNAGEQDLVVGWREAFWDHPATLWVGGDNLLVLPADEMARATDVRRLSAMSSMMIRSGSESLRRRSDAS